MKRSEMKNCNTTFIEKQQKYQHYHQTKLINMNILQAKKYYLLIKVEQVYIFSSCKSIRKTNKNNWGTRKKQVETLQILKRAEQQKLKSIKDVFLKGQQNNYI